MYENFIEQALVTVTIFRKESEENFLKAIAAGRVRLYRRESARSDHI
jgi:hypothetical protein